jgi:endonuclease/exonuclease/phosphatase (EEP) superfamily protein YafD
MSSPLVHRFRTSCRRLPEVLIALTCLALVERLTLRDRLPGFSTLFYATPLPILALGAAGAALAACLLRRPRWAAGSAAGAVLLLAVFLGASHRSLAASKGDEIRGVLWNVSYGMKGWDRVESGLHRRDPDLIAIVEGGTRLDEGREAMFRHVMPDGDARWFKRGMGLAVRGGRILDWTDQVLAEFGRAVIVRTEIRGRPLEVVLVDLDANPLRSRAAAFAALGRALEQGRNGPRLVMGDFNTPWESVHFDPFRAAMHHAFDRAGNGLSPTWPLPLPLLEIDHVWGREVRFTSCAHEDLGASDHRAVAFEFLVEPAPR